MNRVLHIAIIWVAIPVAATWFLGCSIGNTMQNAKRRWRASDAGRGV